MGITAVWVRAPLKKVAMSVVPPPMSISTTPDSRSVSSRQASAEASGSSTIFETLTPQSSTARRRFWMLDRPAHDMGAHGDLAGGEAHGVLDALGAIEY